MENHFKINLDYLIICKAINVLQIVSSRLVFVYRKNTNDDEFELIKSFFEVIAVKHKETNDDETCAICLNDLKNDEKVITLNC